jgi:hypothetical protein
MQKGLKDHNCVYKLGSWCTEVCILRGSNQSRSRRAGTSARADGHTLTRAQPDYIIGYLICSKYTIPLMKHFNLEAVHLSAETLYW